MRTGRMAPSACELLSGAEEFDLIAAVVCPLEHVLRQGVYALDPDNCCPSRVPAMRADGHFTPVDIEHGGKLLITCAEDNLLKGASGQAVENMNIMYGLDRRTGLRLKPSAF